MVWIIQESGFIKIIHNWLCNALHVFGRSVTFAKAKHIEKKDQLEV